MSSLTWENLWLCPLIQFHVDPGSFQTPGYEKFVHNSLFINFTVNLQILRSRKAGKKHRTWRYRSIKQEVRKHQSRKQRTHSQPHVIAACDWCVAKLLVTIGDSINSISLLFWLSLSTYLLYTSIHLKICLKKIMIWLCISMFASSTYIYIYMYIYLYIYIVKPPFLRFQLYTSLSSSQCFTADDFGVAVRWGIDGLPFRLPEGLASSSKTSCPATQLVSLKMFGALNPTFYLQINNRTSKCSVWVT